MAGFAKTWGIIAGATALAGTLLPIRTNQGEVFAWDAFRGADTDATVMGVYFLVAPMGAIVAAMLLKGMPRAMTLLLLGMGFFLVPTLLLVDDMVGLYQGISAIGGGATPASGRGGEAFLLMAFVGLYFLGMVAIQAGSYLRVYFAASLTARLLAGIGGSAALVALLLPAFNGTPLLTLGFNEGVPTILIALPLGVLIFAGLSQINYANHRRAPQVATAAVVCGFVVAVLHGIVAIAASIMAVETVYQTFGAGSLDSATRDIIIFSGLKIEVVTAGIAGLIFVGLVDLIAQRLVEHQRAHGTPKPGMDIGGPGDRAAKQFPGAAMPVGPTYPQVPGVEAHGAGPVAGGIEAGTPSPQPPPAGHAAGGPPPGPAGPAAGGVPQPPQ